MIPTLILLYTLAYIFFVFIDLIPLYQSKCWKLFWTYSILMTVSYIIIFLIVLEVKIPSPAVPIKKAVSAIFGLSE